MPDRSPSLTTDGSSRTRMRTPGWDGFVFVSSEHKTQCWMIQFRRARVSTAGPGCNNTLQPWSSAWTRVPLGGAHVVLGVARVRGTQENGDLRINLRQAPGLV